MLMTYSGFLLRFVVLPIGLLLIAHWLLSRRGRAIPSTLLGFAPVLAVALHVLIAVVYTTPWDNYLVATGVWWYEQELVSGVVIGWVPIEEYAFFILQSLFTALWLLLLMRLLPVGRLGFLPRPGVRVGATSLTLAAWLVSSLFFFIGPAATTYLTLVSSWALLPISLQLAFGADILWHYRRLVFWGIVPTTLYLSLSDSLAIDGGTWTIDPAQSVQLYLGGVLPVEELIFFLVTNTLLVFGLTLLLAEAGRERLLAEIIPWLDKQKVGRLRRPTEG
jgi:lycopene cyclase domain-containing protein